MKSTAPAYTNALINETSPYLLQHAHNPVNWQAWNDTTLQLAKKENKLMLISIGYSACHWCHVMEKECFEDEQVAKVMNAHFICIKIDREERPDIDQIYMQAVQLMTGQGGWPLNCFTLPDGKPIYGGTYFPKKNWLHVLKSLVDLAENEPDKMYQYAEQLTQGVQKSELVSINKVPPAFDKAILEKMLLRWSSNFDNVHGGPNKAPKFPLPNNYQFLLRYYQAAGGKHLLQHITTTLEKMAYGGIYDHIGGGFARYSTDNLWKVPHFEKMLYDNAQLVSLYSEAYQFSKNNLYKQVVYETLGFVVRELTTPEGTFYSALDADSEGVEGKYYVWEAEALQQILKEKYALYADYFNVNDHGLWEENYIPLRRKSDEEIAAIHSITVEELQAQIAAIKKQLLNERESRVRPGLDDKQLTSWNALMIKAYVDAYVVFNEYEFLNVAEKAIHFLLSKVRTADGGLYHNYKNGKATINGFLEDYAFTIEALIALYQATFNEQWLTYAQELTSYSIVHFHDKNSGMFYFTSNTDAPLISRKMELMDNVIPASNSSMAKSLFYLGYYFDEPNYLDISKQMLSNISDELSSYASGYSNWAMLLLHHTYPFYQIAITGNEAVEKGKVLSSHYIPNKIIAGNTSTSKLPFLTDKPLADKTAFYVCRDTTCSAPVNQVEEVLALIEKPNVTT